MTSIISTIFQQVKKMTANQNGRSAERSRTKAESRVILWTMAGGTCKVLEFAR